MLNVNKINCYITQKISIRLKKIKKCLIHKTWLIKYNWVRLFITIHELMNNGKKIDI